MSKYRYIFTMGLQNAMEYRMDFLLSLVSTVFPIIMQVYLWTALYAAGAADSNGYTYEQMILYTLLAGITAKVVSAGFEYEVVSDIKDGGLSKYLVKPVNYYFYRIWNFLGGKIPAIGILLAAVCVVLGGADLVLENAFSFWRILCYLISMIVALILNFALYFSIAMLGFWITEISKLFGTISVVVMVISGGVFPMDIFGDFVTKISNVLPFSYTTQFCVNILNGRLEGQQIQTGILIQCIWSVFFLAVGNLMWKAGMKKYAAVGS